ncbi:MAG: hypothetical protein HC906_07860 [Bacteroidales bacterium]|nr:hypothetical protein [Bacteroidales bacterium]
MNIIFNRKSPGFALDVGFISQYNEQTTLSGSILDLGFLIYRWNAFKYNAHGDYEFHGFLDQTLTDSYLMGQIDAFSDAVNDTMVEKSYPYFLPPRSYFWRNSSAKQ